MPKPTGGRAAPSTPTPESAAAQTRALIEEARVLRLDLMRVLDELVHKLSADVASHAGEGAAVDVDAVMPAVRDLAQVVTVMDRLTQSRRPAPPLDGGRAAPRPPAAGAARRTWSRRPR